VYPTFWIALHLESYWKKDNYFLDSRHTLACSYAIFFFFFAAGLVLNEFIRHFEPAVYDRDALMTQHKRLRRDVTSASQPLSLHIKANSR
jgi:hypothetical protein